MIGIPVLGVLGVMVFYTTKAICKTMCSSTPAKAKEDDNLYIHEIDRVVYTLNSKNREFWKRDYKQFGDMGIPVRTALAIIPLPRNFKVLSSKQVHKNRLEFLIQLPYSSDAFNKAWYYFKDNKWSISSPMAIKDIQAKEYLDNLAVPESPKVLEKSIQARVEITPIHHPKKHHVVHTLGEVPSAVKGKE